AGCARGRFFASEEPAALPPQLHDFTESGVVNSLIIDPFGAGSERCVGYASVLNCSAPMRNAGYRGRALRRLEIGRPIQPPMLLWPKPLDLCLERGFDRPVRRLNGDHARPGIGDTASLADALDLRTLLREFASAQD